jgi:hypothetical protein
MISARRQPADQMQPPFRREAMTGAEWGFPDWRLPLEEAVPEFDRYVERNAIDALLSLQTR